MKQPTQGAHRGVYPRVCGGTSIALTLKLITIGLSPRVRGNRRYSHRHMSKRRSIPACAGEPFTSVPSGKVIKVYPRVCGGTSIALTLKLITIGLSPRVRGNHAFEVGDDLAQRSIPACAGEPE